LALQFYFTGCSNSCVCTFAPCWKSGTCTRCANPALLFSFRYRDYLRFSQGYL